MRELLVQESTASRASVKKRLLHEGLLEDKCYECGMSGYWNGKPIVMVLDHKNGVNDDYRIENLRMLCPNCNSQQTTFAGRHNKGKVARIPKEKHPCVGCGKSLGAKRKTGSCVSCAKKVGGYQKAEIPVSLVADVAKYGVRQVSRRYGVSHTTISRWMRSLQ